MLVVPKGAPASTPDDSSKAADARARAIAAFNKGAPVSAQPPTPKAPEQFSPVPNPTQVSPEELGAIKGGQDNTIEGASEANSNPPTQSSEASPPSPPSSSTPEATKEEEQPLSSQYAQLARKEKALRAKAQAQEAAIKAKEAAIVAREEAIKAKEAEYATKYISKDTLKQNTWDALSEVGVTYEQLTQEVLNPKQGMDNATKAYIQKLEEKLNKLEADRDTDRQSQQTQQAEQYKQAVNQIRLEAKQLVETDPNYESIKETSSVEDVVKLIEDTFKEDGVLMTVEQAAKEVEDHIAEQLYSYSTKIKKIQQRLKPATPQVAPQVQQVTQSKLQPQQQPQQTVQMKTLTNAVSSSRKLTARERAILAFKGELKQ